MPKTKRDIKGARKRVVILLGTSLYWREMVMQGIAGYAHEHEPWHVYAAPEGSEDTLFFGSRYQWDGIIARVTTRELIRKLKQANVPVVNISAAHGNTPSIQQVRIDEGAVAVVAVSHLAAVGYRTFAYGGRWEMVEPRTSIIAKWAAEHSHKFNDYRSFTRLPKNASWARRQRDLTEWLAQLSKPIGIFAWSSEMACRLVECCNAIGAEIPADVGILAGDDDKMRCELSHPTISGVQLPAEKLGYESAKMLDLLMRAHTGPGTPELVQPSGSITVRQSTNTNSLAGRDIHRAIQFITTNLDQSLSVDDIARHVLLSRRSLERQFRQITGRSPHQAIIQARVDRAKRLLLETRWSTRKVSEVCGLSSPAHLNRLFHRYEGKTPSRFRQQLRIGS